MIYLTDGKRHLICLPYSIENLHIMAAELDIKRCWFHNTHYDIPKRRIKEIESKCKLVTSKDIVRIIKMSQKNSEERKLIQDYNAGIFSLEGYNFDNNIDTFIERLQEFKDKLLSSYESITFEFSNEAYHYDDGVSPYFRFTGSRLENDKEYELRLKKEEKSQAIEKKRKEKAKDDEKALFLKLKKKYEPNGNN